MNSNLVVHFAGSSVNGLLLTQPARQDSGGGNLFGEREEEAKVISGVGEM